MIMKSDPVLITIFSNLLVNLSAGWLGATIIVPLNTKPAGKMRFLALIANLFFATLSILIAYLLIKQL